LSLASLFGARWPGHAGRVHEEAAAYWDRRSWRLRCILEGGRFTIHDIVNDARIREAVREQWRLGKIMDEDRAVESYIRYLEYLEAVSRGEVPPAPARRRPSLFSV
jgi:hypothetical protein